MSRIQIRQRAGQHERYARTAFDGQIGKELPVTIDGRARGTGRLVAVEVTEDGAEVLLTFEVAEGVTDMLTSAS